MQPRAERIDRTDSQSWLQHPGWLVLEEGLEPPRPFGTRDFESQGGAEELFCLQRPS